MSQDILWKISNTLTGRTEVFMSDAIHLHGVRFSVDSRLTLYYSMSIIR